MLLLLPGIFLLLGIVVAFIVVVAQLGPRSPEALAGDRRTSSQLTAGCVILLAAGVAALVWAIRTYAYR